jgi:predicted TIM-barrel fold metal-dependent hydrolase
MIDSCIHFEKSNINYIRKISKNLQSKGITCALSIFDNENTFTKREQFRENCKKFRNLLPVALIRNTKDLNSEFNHIKKLEYKFIKIHPRILKIALNNQDFYIKLFKKIKKTKLNVMWCTFDGWAGKANEANQLELLSKLINLIPKNKIILMHGGGPNLLKFYERFRFLNNVFLDLSYTLVQYQKTSLEKDIIFLMKKFDKRIIIGCDYPTFSLNIYQRILRRLLKESKINENKKKNILKNNIMKIING